MTESSTTSAPATIVNPDRDTPAEAESLAPLKQLLGFLWPHKFRMIAAGTALVFTAGAQLTLGYGVKILIDEGFAGADSSGLYRAVTFMLVIGIAMAIGAMTRFYLVSWLGERVSADLRGAVFNNLVHLQPSYFETNHSGEIMSRLTTDTTLLQTLIGSSVSLAVRNTLTLTGALTLMIITNLKLSLVILVAVPVTLLPILIFGRRVRKLSNRSQQTIAEVGSHAGEIFQSIKVVQSFNRETAEKAAFARDVEQAFAVARSRVFQRALLTGFAIFLLMGGMVGMMWSGGVDVIEGRMTGGELGAFVFYAVIVGTAFATLSEVWGDLQRAVGAAERLMQLLAETSEIPDTGTQTPASKTALAFEGVHFTYPSRPTHLALNDFTLEIAHGESVALVGPSGAGKSTVFELMLRFYDPIAGAIRFGGADLREMSLDRWRQKIALVPQQPTLFSGDIFYNIAYGATEPTQEAVEAAAEMAHAHEFIQSLPGGYQSHLGAQGVRLSGGQRQRIALARAILSDPELLLLDEATSALDTESEWHVQQALTEIVQERTTIIIAHRLSTVINADRIVVMDQGQMIDCGPHDELITRCALYQRLARLQFQN
ncbi:ABC transporter transmembrane domain-containing protein [Luminiphilus sp.]|nr:ABC transporter transmembrane domain-containing protein [Luminiphilus sp.]MDA9711110.1 ABC transporter transmembrane domain-containing protein [Luminiphilus sp.]